MNSTRLALWAVAGLTGVFCTAMGLASYRIYHRMRWYETQFNNLILDPYQLNAYPPGETPARQGGNQRVVFFGDSRAASWPAPQSIKGFEFLNRGLDAQSAAQAAGRFTEHILPLAPDFLVVQVGVNDLRVAALYPEQEQGVYASCLARIREILHQARQIDAVVVLTMIFPTGEATLDRRWNGQADRLRRLIEEANAELARLGGEGVIVLDSTSVLADQDGQLKAEYQLDELHLNAAGYAALNVKLIEVLALNAGIGEEGGGKIGNE